MIGLKVQTNFVPLWLVKIPTTSITPIEIKQVQGDVKAEIPGDLNIEIQVCKLAFSYARKTHIQMKLMFWIYSNYHTYLGCCTRPSPHQCPLIFVLFYFKFLSSFVPGKRLHCQLLCFYTLACQLQCSKELNAHIQSKRIQQGNCPYEAWLKWHRAQNSYETHASAACLQLFPRLSMVLIHQVSFQKTRKNKSLEFRIFTGDQDPIRFLATSFACSILCWQSL